MIWLIFFALTAVIGLVVLFVIWTDGRYFGKGLMWRIYDRLGPAIFDARSEAERWRDLAAALQLRGDEKMLDVGSAAGDLPLTIAAMPGFQGQVVGVDWSPRMIAAAQAKAARRDLGDRASFQTADVRKGLSFDGREFDVIFCLGLLETLPHPEQILGVLESVLKPDGALVLSLYRGWATRHAAPSLDWYQAHLTPLGFRRLQVIACRRHHDVVIARRAADTNQKCGFCPIAGFTLYLPCRLEPLF